MKTINCIQIFLNKKDMNSLVSLLWVILTLAGIYTIQLFIDLTNQAQNIYSTALPTTKCLSSSQNHQSQNEKQKFKLCVHCLSKSFTSGKYSKSPVKFNSTVLITNQKYQYSKNSVGLSTMNVKHQKDFFCEEYLQMINTDSFNSPTNTKLQLQLENQPYIYRMLQLLSAQVRPLKQVQKSLKSQTFSLTSQNIQQHVIFQVLKLQQAEQFPANPLSVTAKYMNQTFMTKVINQFFLYSFVFAMLLVMVLYFLQKNRNHHAQNYYQLVALSIVQYLLLAYHIMVNHQNQTIQALIWAVFILVCIAKINNCDGKQYRTTIVAQILYSATAALAIYSQNRLYKTLFFTFFLFCYIIYSKLLSRVCSKRKYFNGQSPIATLVYMAVLFSFFIESLVIQHYYELLYFKEIQIFKYGTFIVVPIIFILMTYFQNQMEVEVFQEYKQSKGMKIIQENQFDMDEHDQPNSPTQ